MGGRKAYRIGWCTLLNESRRIPALIKVGHLTLIGVETQFTLSLTKGEFLDSLSFGLTLASSGALAGFAREGNILPEFP